MATHSNITPSGVHATGLPSPPPLADIIAPEKLRNKIEAAVARLIAAHDLIDGDADYEPSLGAAEPTFGRAPWYGGVTVVTAGQCRWAEGSNDDRESVDEDGTDLDRGELDLSDHEPSLGSLDGHIDQRDWGKGGRSDFEENHYV